MFIGMCACLYVFLSYVSLLMSLLLSLIRPWAVTPSPSNTGTSLLLSTVGGQKKPSNSSSKIDRTPWQILWTAMVAKGQEGKVRMQPFPEWGGKKRTSADAHNKVFSGLHESNFPQAAKPAWGSREWYFIHSLPCLKYLFQTMFLCSVSCCLLSMLPKRWKPPLPLQSADKAQYKKAVLQGTHLCLSHHLFPPPSSLPLPSSDVSYTEFCWPETVSPSRQRPCLFCVFARCCFSPWNPVLHCSSISLAMQSFTPSLTQNPTSKMHSNSCGSWISSSSKAECSINGMSTDW